MFSGLLAAPEMSSHILSVMAVKPSRLGSDGPFESLTGRNASIVPLSWLLALRFRHTDIVAKDSFSETSSPFEGSNSACCTLARCRVLDYFVLHVS